MTEKSNSNHVEIMWKFHGNDDGELHGLLTCHQMLEWTSYGYVVGASAMYICWMGSADTNDAGGKMEVNLSE